MSWPSRGTLVSQFAAAAEALRLGDPAPLLTLIGDTNAWPQTQRRLEWQKDGKRSNGSHELQQVRLEVRPHHESMPLCELDLTFAPGAGLVGLTAWPDATTAGRDRRDAPRRRRS